MSFEPCPDTSPDALLDDPSSYLNRELSLLDFHRRVLAQAADARLPLLERLRFLTISGSNLDEFFEIRVSGLRQQRALGVGQVGQDGLDVDGALAAISRSAHELVAEQYRVLIDLLLPELRREGIELLRPREWSPAQAGWIEGYFRREILPVLTPVGLDPAHPFPRVQNKSLNMLVALEGEDAFGRSSGVAVVQVPRSLPRLVAFPREVAGAPHGFALVSGIVEANVSELFPGMRVTGCYPFRLTRNSDLWVEQEEIDDLLRAVRGELPRRNYGDAVRLEVTEDCPADRAQFLLSQFGLEPADLYASPGPVNLVRLQALYDAVDRADLKYRPFAPAASCAPPGSRDAFQLLREGDVLLHHPYQGFEPVLDFMRQAAADPAVLAIKQTLYRSGYDSPAVERLIEAARAGKEVTVVIELMARFDEAANVDLATRLQDAGANVVYGVVGYKTHAKMLLVVRREGRRVRRYAHLGTGNYHAGTARAYTDLSLLTADRDLCEDVHHLFQQLTGLGRVLPLKKVLASPFALHSALLERIEAESAAARAGRPARILARMNSLSEPAIIRALYRASRAGVPIDLLVRGICSLRPGVPGLSENIRVRSVVGRFLEHSRVFCFHAGGAELVYASSADWMARNFFRRVEACFPIEDRSLRRRAIDEALLPYLEDDRQAWELGPDGTWARVASRGEGRAAQEVLLERLGQLRHNQAQPELAQGQHLVVEVGPREGVGGEPGLGEAELEGVPVRRELHGRPRARAPASVQQHGEPQQDRQA